MKKEIIILENGITENDVLNALICIHETLLQKSREDECKALRIILNSIGVDRLKTSTRGIPYDYEEMEDFNEKHENFSRLEFYYFPKKTKFKLGKFINTVKSL